MHLPVIWRFLRIVFLALVTMTISRVIFLFNAWDIFSESGLSDVLIALIHGVRFDAVVIAWAFIPIWMLLIIPNRKNSLLNWLFLAILNLATFANIIDTELFKFTAKRMTGDFFKFIFLSNDALHIGPDLLLSFWYLVVAWCVMAWFTYWVVIKKQWLNSPLSYTIGRLVFSGILIISTVVLGVRGGWQAIPLAIFNAGDYGNPSNSILVLNSPFTFIKTVGKKPLINEVYFDSEQLTDYYSPKRKLRRNADFGRFRNKNVVVIIAESLSKEYMGCLNRSNLTYTPLLDSLTKHSVLCTDAYANGHRSIDGIPAVLSSIPSLMYEPFITSSFGANRQFSLPSALKGMGYQTMFFHGGNNGTMGFNSYCKTAGVDHYIGLDEYPDQEHYDGAWGIYDHHFLNFTAERLGKEKKPFFATIFTLSSHHPYSLPDQFLNTFPKGTLDIHESLGYLDYSINEFLRSASKSDWYENTVFIITADHTSLSHGGYFRSYSGVLSLPIIMFAPGDTSFVGTIDGTASQADIPPSVLHLLGYEKEVLSFGNNLFDSLENNFSVALTRDQYQLISNGTVIRFNGKEMTAVFEVATDSLHKKNLINQPSSKVDSLNKILKSYIQQFSERAYSNTLQITESDE